MKRFFNVLAITLACVFAVGMTACEGGGGGGGSLNVNPGTLEFAWAGGSEYVTVTGNDWTVTASAGITAVKEGNSVKVTVGATAANKNGTVTISNGSDSKTVTVKQLLSVDDLVGTWDATCGWLNGDDNNFYNVPYTVTAQKVNATTIKFVEALGWNSIYTFTGGPCTDEIVATIDREAGTVNVAGGQDAPGMWKAGYFGGQYAWNAGVAVKETRADFPPFKVGGTAGNLTFNWTNPNGEEVTNSGVTCDVVMLVFADADPTTCLGWAEILIEVNYTKTAASGAPKMAKMVKMDNVTSTVTLPSVQNVR